MGARLLSNGGVRGSYLEPNKRDESYGLVEVDK